MDDELYRRLAEHLDRLPGGFAPSRTGADMRLLKLLYRPEDAGLAVYLTLDRESAAAIGARAGLPAEIARQRLDEMADRGLIYSYRDERGETVYQAAPMVVGIYELQVNNLTPEVLDAFETYWHTAEDRPRPETVSQMRTIPIGESIDVRLEAMTYEQVGEIVKAHEKFAVAPCICRRHARLRGKGCSAPEESCLIFGDGAEYYARTGRGRAVSREEMQALIARADAANLVLQPSNSQDVTFICCCCGCCCGVLGGLKQHPRPADIAASAFIAAFDPQACQACWTCLDRCQMGALEEARQGDRVEFKAERCIGCGLCVTTCPSGALTLTRKPPNEHNRVPATMTDTWRMISEAQKN